MQALRKPGAEPGLELVEVAEPGAPAAGEVLIAVEAVGICGSDVHVFEWTSGYEWMRAALPVTLGHEFAGRVVAVGEGVSEPVPGDPVTVQPTASCGVCAACLKDSADLCTAKRTLGLTRDGAFAPLVTAPAASCFRLPPGVDAELGALAEPLCVAAHALEVGGLRLGHSVVVLGAGTIGQAIAFLAKRAGAAPVILAGLDDAPRLAAAQDLGIEHTVDLAEEDLAAAVGRIAGGKVEMVLEATGVPASIRDGLAILQRRGVLVTTGIHAEPVAFDLTGLVRSQHQLRGSHASTRRDFETVVRLLGEEGDRLRAMITHRLPLADGIRGFELARQRSALKVMLRP